MGCGDKVGVSEELNHHITMTTTKSNTVEIKPSQIVRACLFGSLVIAYAKNKWGKERGTIIDAKHHSKADSELFEHFYRNHRIEMEPTELHRGYFGIAGNW